MQDLLAELGRQLFRQVPVPAAAPAELPSARAEPTVDVLYALTPVVDGQALSGRLLVRLPHHPGADEPWTRVDWQDLGRAVAQAVARASGAGVADAERTTRLSDDTVVTLDLVRRPAAAAAGRAGPVPSG